MLSLTNTISKKNISLKYFTMMKFQSLILFLFILLANHSYAQVPVGLQFDINGQALHGYFDPITYSPIKKLTYTHNSDSYETGHYYNLAGHKIVGLIKFAGKKIFFQTKLGKSKTTLKPELIKSFVIGVDSFFVVSNFQYKNRLITKSEYAQFITEFDGYTFAKHYRFPSEIGPANYEIIETYLVKKKNETVWNNFYLNKKFDEKALKHFGHIPEIKSKLLSYEYSDKNTLSMIKMCDYWNKYNLSEPILFDQFWQETQNKENAKYHANITSKKDSIWTFDYYQDSVKLYTISYSSFYPNVKNGELTVFYPNGTIRRTCNYMNNEAIDEKTYDENGSLASCFEHIKKQKPSSFKIKRKTLYKTIADTLGTNILTSDGPHAIKRYDNLRNVSYTHVYINNELVSSYRLLNKDTVFQISTPSYDFKIKSIQKSFSFYMMNKDIEKALNVNAQGIILVSVVIDKKGYVIESKLLNSLHPQIDALVKKFINGKLPTPIFDLNRFKSYKRNKKKQFCEFVLPFEFGIDRFYRKPVNFYHFHPMYHWNSMPKFSPPPPPSFSRGF